MKKLTPVIPLLLALLFFTTISVMSQETSMGQLYSIHEDVVIPSKVQMYEEAAKNLASMFREHQIPSMSYNAASTNDLTYLYIAPVNRLADLEKMDVVFEELEQKVGKEAYESVMGRFSECYNSHRDYMIRLRTDLSYKPEYGNNPSDGLNYRSWEFYHVYPGKEMQMEEMAKKWQALYAKHNIPEGYRIYQGDMGTAVPMLIIVQSAKNAVEYAMASERVMKAMGEEGEKLWYDTMAFVHKIEQKTGMMRPDLSYILGQMATASDPE